MARRPVTAILAISILCGSVAGCTSGPSYEVLDAAGDSNDSLPPLPERAVESAGGDAGSSRHAGGYRMTGLFATRSADGACLLVYPSQWDFKIECGEGQVEVAMVDRSFILAPDDFPEPAGATAIGPNVWMRELP